MKLIFGDPDSIKFRDEYIIKETVKQLLKKVKCPFCRAKATNALNIDIKEQVIGWNFDCKDDCPNSLEFAEANGYDFAQTDTDFNGKFINYDEAYDN